ncbi:MAG TPA: glycoside hydrolase family 15 protein [Rhizomicrobium sp.]|nr:glycoside hydrolase family 15 protein [Rhizomicrobium sp.]
MTDLTIAPKGTSSPTWTSSAKDMVTTALGTSRVWVTLGYGIVNEIYWPSSGSPQIRDLGFIVFGPKGWHEVKRVACYTITAPSDHIPLPQIVHEHPDYRLELEIVPDPDRDVVLISFRLHGDNLRLYALLAPHLANSGMHNNACAGAELYAWKGIPALCLASDCGFSRSSAGHVGVSDGWQDFAQNGRMSWTYNAAIDGNVALMGELAANEGTLALGFSASREGARTLACSSLSVGFSRIRDCFVEGWRDWGHALKIPAMSQAVDREAHISAAVLKVHEDRTFPGSIVASLSVPWGNSSDSLGGYHLVWPRDCVKSGFALIAAGRIAEARNMLSWLIATQKSDGTWSQNSFPDGRPFWTGIQLDEVAFPVLLAARLREENALAGIGGVTNMIARAAGYIARNGPITSQDRWEENAGLSPFTLAVSIVAMIVASEFVDHESGNYLHSLVDCWNERIEEWTYAKEGPLAEMHDVDGYYIRIGPSAAEGGLQGAIELRNRNAVRIPAAALVGMEFLALVRTGLRSPKDPRIVNTVAVTDSLLKVETPSGTAYRRYNGDGYGEHADGSPFDGTGIGRAWPLLAAERGEYELMLGNDPLPWLETITRMTGPAGLIPEQVWDAPDIVARGLAMGKPSGSAMPLVWAHAEFLKLVYARERKRPLEFLNCVATYLKQDDRAKRRAWHWRIDTPFDVLPQGRDLLVDLATPFVLHLGFDGWQSVQDKPSIALPFGRHGVRLTAEDFGRWTIVNFTFYFPDEDRWQGADYHVRLA